jgi:hypothetical protein
MSRELLQQALDLLEVADQPEGYVPDFHDTIKAIRAHLAAQQNQSSGNPGELNLMAAQPLHEQLREMGEAHAAQPAPVPDLIPQDALFVCGQMGANVTRVRAESAAPVPADPQAGAVAWGAPSADGKIYIAWHERTDACTIPLYTDPAAPVPVPLGWMPIETAPKDGVIFLIGYTPNSRMDRRVFEARWHDAQQKFTSVNGFLLFDNATHWMPLPPPPGIAAYPEVPK